MSKEFIESLPKKECSICKKLFPAPSVMAVPNEDGQEMCSSCALNYEHDRVDSFFKSLGKKK